MESIESPLHEVSSACCPPGSYGQVAAPVGYTPKGTMQTLEKSNGQCYVVSGGYPDCKKGIIMCPDLFGIESGRTKYLADQYAEKGYTVALVESFNGGAFTDNMKALQFPRVLCNMPKVISFMKRNKWERVAKYYDDAIELLKSKGIDSIGVAGFCWGAYPEAYLGQKEIIKALVFFHPSITTVAYLSGSRSWQEIVNDIKCPVLVAASLNEPASVSPGGRFETIVKEKEFGEKCEFHKFRQRHGWVNRGDINDETVRAGAQEAFDKSFDFFSKHL